MWSVGCMFAELYFRKPIFKGKNPADQVKIILELIGTPNKEDLIASQEGIGKIKKKKNFFNTNFQILLQNYQLPKKKIFKKYFQMQVQKVLIY